MSAVNKNSNDKFYELETLRGLAILGVVIIHVTAPLLFLKIENYSLSYYLLLVINQSQRFCVPAFLIISGFLLSYKIENQSNPDRVLKKRISKIIPPYLIWSAILYISKKHFDIKEFVWDILTGSVNYVYYFIILIIQFYLLWWVWAKYNKFFSLKQFLFLSIAIQGIFTLYNYLVIFGYALPLPLANRWIFGWIFYFVFGLFLGNNYSDYKKMIVKSRFWIISATIIFLFLSILESALINNFTQDISNAVSFFKLSSQGFALSSCLSVILLSKPSIFLKKLAEFSFPIYLIHEPIIIIWGPLYRILKQNITLTILITIVLSTGISYAFAAICYHILPKKYTKYLLGL